MSSRDEQAKQPNQPKIPKRWVGCSVEGDYYGDERKVSRAHRKEVSAKDRSKYKTTDQRQQAKQKREVVEGKDFEKGRVLSIASQGITVEADGEILTCTLRGSLKKEKTQFKNLVVVGDFVLFERSSKEEGFIVQVEPRRTVLSRADNLSRRKEQLIAANIDQVLITVSVVSPEIKTALIDRYIIATQKGGMEPVLVVNKIDLLTAHGQDQVMQEKEQEIYQELLLAYQKAGVPVISLSAETGEGLDQLKLIMKDKSSVFSGQSGVGKSSLINAMTGGSLRTGGMVEKTNKGTHTTTMAQLIPLEFGGWCIDTPGIKSFGVWDLDKEEIEQYFPEIFECGHQCRYTNCSHLHESGCAVKVAVENREISWLRYESYLMLMQSEAEGHSRR